MTTETRDGRCPYCGILIAGLLFDYFDEGEQRLFRCSHCGELIDGERKGSECILRQYKDEKENHDPLPK